MASSASTRVAIKRNNHAVTWATRHFISLISIRKKYESNFKEISKLHLLVVIYECTSGQRKHRQPKMRERWRDRLKIAMRIHGINSLATEKERWSVMVNNIAPI